MAKMAKISAKVFGLLIAYLMITKDRKPVSQKLKNIESRIRVKDKSSFTIHAKKKWPFTPSKKFREHLVK